MNDKERKVISVLIILVFLLSVYLLFAKKEYMLLFFSTFALIRFVIMPYLNIKPKNEGKPRFTKIWIIIYIIMAIVGLIVGLGLFTHLNNLL